MEITLTIRAELEIVFYPLTNWIALLAGWNYHQTIFMNVTLKSAS